MNSFRRTRIAALLAIAALTLAAPITLAGASSAAASPCEVVWGSLPESSNAASAAQLVDVRSAPHRCFDRIVVDLNRRPAGYSVRYVRQVTQDGSGDPVPLRGRARMAIVVRAPAYDADGTPTYQPANPGELTDVSGYRAFRQLAWAGSFEGQSTIGLGVRARLPFRTFTLDGPGTGSRLVVDVAHRW
jgi:hypothetical protein